MLRFLLFMNTSYEPAAVMSGNSIPTEGDTTIITGDEILN